MADITVTDDFEGEAVVELEVKVCGSADSMINYDFQLAEPASEVKLALLEKVGLQQMHDSYELRLFLNDGQKVVPEDADNLGKYFDNPGIIGVEIHLKRVNCDTHFEAEPDNQINFDGVGLKLKV